MLPNLLPVATCRQCPRVDWATAKLLVNQPAGGGGVVQYEVSIGSSTPPIQHHKSCIQFAGSQKETTSARHCSEADFLKTIQNETTLALPCTVLEQEGLQLAEGSFRDHVKGAAVA